MQPVVNTENSHLLGKQNRGSVIKIGKISYCVFFEKLL